MNTEHDDIYEEAKVAIKADEDSMEMREAILEYAYFLDDAAREPFRLRLKNDPDFYACMCKVISEMSMLIASAAAMDEESEFRTLQSGLLFDSIKDTQEMRAMRLFYIKNGGELDMERIMESEAERLRYMKRLESFLSFYLEIHPD